jgi:hypothetical protein
MKKINISFADLANKLGIGIDEKKVEDISHLGIQIKSYDIEKDIEVYKPMTHFIVKDSVDQYCVLDNEGNKLKTTTVHRTWDKENSQWVESYDKLALNEAALMLEPMNVVDCSVQDTECYIANGFINHNTTPGGKALKFAASVRIKLMGRSAVKVLDPITQKVYNSAIAEWDLETQEWKKAGGSKSGSAKPKKPAKKDFKGNEVTIGYDIVAKTVKNKVGPPDREAEFRIVFTEGIIEEEAWFDYAENCQLFEKVNSYTYCFAPGCGIEFKDAEGESIEFKKSEWLDTVMCDVDIREKVKDIVISSLILETRGDSAPSSHKLVDEDEGEKSDEKH